MYDTLKTLIENNRYTKTEIQKKLNVYLKAAKITEEEYTELIGLINDEGA